VNPSKDIDIRRWATEGLAYLTLDADIKEELVNDSAALKSLIDVTTVCYQVHSHIHVFKWNMLVRNDRDVNCIEYASP
jgi:hypothetical protein